MNFGDILDSITSIANQELTPIDKQVKGIDPISGIEYIYRIDGAGKILFRYDESTDAWIPNFDYKPYPVPISFSSVLSDEDLLLIKQTMAAQQQFVSWITYIKYGDEPSGELVLNLKAYFYPEDYNAIKKLMSTMPRQLLKPWFKKTIASNMPGESSYANNPAYSVVNGPANLKLEDQKPYELVNYAAFIQLFNEANSEYVAANSLNPWTWEQKKLEDFYNSQNKQELIDLRKQTLEVEGKNASRRADFLIQKYESLPKIGDPGLELRREFAVKTLIDREEYDTAEGIIAAYEYAQYTILGKTMEKPLPFNIVAADGTTVVATKVN